MSNFSPSYLTAALREDGLEGSLAAVGTINDLINALVHLEGLHGTANFQRDFETSRRMTLSKAIDLVRDSKALMNETGQSIDGVFRAVGNARLGFAVAIVILFISLWAGGAASSMGYGLYVGFGTAAVLTGAAWYFWSWIRLTLGNSMSFAGPGPSRPWGRGW